ncbi:hypothetical protein HII12_005165 [Brettanomyces bruxellensis]|nr:hypothetical protein HII12_005165 [Brettanomyces bruxellensis]
MLLIFGQSDMLIDMDKLRAQVIAPMEVINVPGYEHMDTLWARDVESTVFDKVIKKLEIYTNKISKKRAINL